MEPPLPQRLCDALKRHQALQNAERDASWRCLGRRAAGVHQTRQEARSTIATTREHFKALLARAEVGCDKATNDDGTVTLIPRARPHDLRHTAASLLLAQGAPARVVMKILGHSQIAITMNIYSHVMPTQLASATDAIADALWSEED